MGEGRGWGEVGHLAGVAVALVLQNGDQRRRVRRRGPDTELVLQHNLLS